MKWNSDADTSKDSSNPTRVLSERQANLTLILESDYRKFTKSERDNIVSTLSKIADIPQCNIKIIRVEEGSVIITIKLPESAALKILNAFNSGNNELKKHNIRSVVIPAKDSKIVSKPIKMQVTVAEHNVTGSIMNKCTARTGVVKWFNNSKGFGFITQDNGEDVYVHYSAIEGGFESLNEGDKVTFEVKESPKGKGIEAVNVMKNKI